MKISTTRTTPERRRLSFPGADLGLSRRRFLQMSAAGAGGVALSPLLSHLEAFAAPALGPHDPILVLVQLDGGNDGLNTICPVGVGTYYDLRPSIAIQPQNALQLKPGVGLHPSLFKLKTRYDRGWVAAIRGVGYTPPDFSHFSSMEYWMKGWGGSTQTYPTGWVGRWADGLPNSENETMYQVVLDQSIPLHHVGNKNQAAGLPIWLGDAFGIEREYARDIRLLNALSSYNYSSTGLGAWGDEIAATGQSLVKITGKIAPAYQGTLPNDYFVRQMVLAAKLVNVNLGVRVFSTHIGGFDNHASQGGQAGDHANLLRSFDEGVYQFFKALLPQWRRQVLVMTFSEFGRRPEQNGDNGTDHGTSGHVFLIGERVRGGLYGLQPKLGAGDLVDYGNLRTHVDFRSVYATVLRRWLGADDRAILGRQYEYIDCIASTP
jgi:uncharacterized protein (DUF1501 family)